MNKELQYITTMLQTAINGEPWFGRSVYSILNETDPSTVYIRPGGASHSIADLLYHMILWTDFALKRIEKDPDYDEQYMTENDWRAIDPDVHTWQIGMDTFKYLNEQIISLLQTKDDSLLAEKVDFREYNFRFLLHGMIQHHIYHLGQVAYVKKLLENDF